MWGDFALMFTIMFVSLVFLVGITNIIEWIVFQIDGPERRKRAMQEASKYFKEKR